MAVSDVLVIFALAEEAKGHFDDLSPLYCGVGKVNAAYRLMRSLASWRYEHGRMPDMVLNLGSAGSPHFRAGEVVNCTHFVQRDFDTTAVGTPLYVTPFEDTPVVLANGVRFADFHNGICGTGDNFATDSATEHWNVVDMEAYAIAKVCALEGVPFGCLKYITDGADGQAASSWETGVEQAASRLREAFDIALKSYSSARANGG